MSDRPCSVVDCGRPNTAMNLCAAHYRRLRVHGDVLADRPVGVHRHEGPCAADGCERPARSGGWCDPHYKRVWRHGDAEAGRPIRGTLSHCMIDGCSRSINSRGLCSAHYRKVNLYSITLDQMVRLEAGEYPCEICGVETATDVDHCHASGATRGFLCNPCNRALAAARDSASVLRSAADYLDQSKKRGSCEGS